MNPVITSTIGSLARAILMWLAGSFPWLAPHVDGLVQFLVSGVVLAFTVIWAYKANVKKINMDPDKPAGSKED